MNSFDACELFSIRVRIIGLELKKIFIPLLERRLVHRLFRLNEVDKEIIALLERALELEER